MADKSFMEIENRREKKRWNYISELGGIFGDRQHNIEDFRKIFVSRVRFFECRIPLKVFECHNFTFFIIINITFLR